MTAWLTLGGLIGMIFVTPFAAMWVGEQAERRRQARLSSGT